MASRILPQDEARARRGPMEGQWLSPGSSEQRSSCGRRRSQHDRSNYIVPAQGQTKPEYLARIWARSLG